MWMKAYFYIFAIDGLILRFGEWRFVIFLNFQFVVIVRFFFSTCRVQSRFCRLFSMLGGPWCHCGSTWCFQNTIHYRPSKKKFWAVVTIYNRGKVIKNAQSRRRSAFLITLAWLYIILLASWSFCCPSQYKSSELLYRVLIPINLLSNFNSTHLIIGSVFL